VSTCQVALTHLRFAPAQPHRAVPSRWSAINGVGHSGAEQGQAGRHTVITLLHCPSPLLAPHSGQAARTRSVRSSTALMVEGTSTSSCLRCGRSECCPWAAPRWRGCLFERSTHALAMTAYPHVLLVEHCLECEQDLGDSQLHAAVPCPLGRLLIAVGLPVGAALELRVARVQFGFKAVLCKEHMRVS